MELEVLSCATDGCAALPKYRVGELFFCRKHGEREFFERNLKVKPAANPAPVRAVAARKE
jgi:hypothetical protein